jgi:cell division transport system permease protein
VARKRNHRGTAWLLHHLMVLVGSIGFLFRQPLSTLMTSAVIAIALALPSGLYIALNNASEVSAGWDGSTQISLYLNPDIDEEQAGQLVARLKLDKDVERVALISREQGLQQFQALSGFGDALAFLESNPLPVVITVQPVVDPMRPHSIDSLMQNLQEDRMVELAQLDMQWVQRLYAILEAGQRAVLLIGGLLGLAVLLIVGNTIRLDIQNRREEIEVSKLIGASDAFIRRPFLYTGMLYGVIGGLLALLLIALSLSLLEAPIQRLSLLYHSSYQLSGLSRSDSLNLLLLSALLGLVGSWIAVGRHLRDIEPS